MLKKLQLSITENVHIIVTKFHLTIFTNDTCSCLRKEDHNYNLQKSIPVFII